MQQQTREPGGGCAGRAAGTVTVTRWLGELDRGDVAVAGRKAAWSHSARPHGGSATASRSPSTATLACSNPTTDAGSPAAGVRSRVRHRLLTAETPGTPEWRVGLEGIACDLWYADSLWPPTAWLPEESWSR